MKPKFNGNKTTPLNPINFHYHNQVIAANLYDRAYIENIILSFIMTITRYFVRSLAENSNKKSPEFHTI